MLLVILIIIAFILCIKIIFQSSRLLYIDSIGKQTTYNLDLYDGTEYHSYNPSLCMLKGIKYIWIRNSTANHCTIYNRFNHIWTSIKNKHSFGILNNDNTCTIIEKDINIPYKFESSIGIEDVRMTVKSGADYITLTGTIAVNTSRQQYYARLNPENMDITNEFILSYSNATKFEKNWVPFYKDGKMYVIYTFIPYIILRVNEDTGVCTKIYEKTLQLPYNIQLTDFMRGGSSLFELVDNKYYIGIAHYTIFKPLRKYRHFFYLVDKDSNIVAISSKFCLGANNTCGVQFCIGLIVENDKVYLSYGEEDCYSNIVVIPLSQLLNTLIPMDIKTRKCGLSIGTDRPPPCLDMYFMMLWAVTTALSTAGITYWLDYGTLLGAVRENDIIRHTNDVDLSCLLSQENDIMNILKTTMTEYFVSNRNGMINNTQHWITVQRRGIEGINMDIALRVIKGDMLVDPHVTQEKTNKNSLHMSDVYPLQSISMRNVSFQVPNNTHDVLTKYYGDYTVVDRFKHA